MTERKRRFRVRPTPYFPETLDISYEAGIINRDRILVTDDPDHNEVTVTIDDESSYGDNYGYMIMPRAHFKAFVELLAWHFVAGLEVDEASAREQTEAIQ